MRIISGNLKGRSIPVPKRFSGRPTTDFAREALFNILNHQVDFNGLRVLDLFSGTGAFSLECFSRGAGDITAVEASPVHSKNIEENFRHFGASQAQLIRSDVFLFLKKQDIPFDLIFADPPFDLLQLSELPPLVQASGLLSPTGLFILEHPETMDFSAHTGFKQHRRYGNVHFTFFRPLPA
ncbi:MAG: 16S rRNA (guanine(966)-N(2))-methyltransferase RsmD [Crocinitomicaceae bacterium]|nr:16S rRNA (guanine(966)-N(2))-methyltransferase RsmD [Crocinitomicaceae bacterium]